MSESDTRGYQSNPTDDGSSTVPSTDCYPQDTDHITVDELFQALSNRRRRRVIHAVEDGARDLGALARAIAAVENDITTDEVDAQQRKRVWVSLYQGHLEQLDNWRVVEWDAQAQTIAPGPAHETALETMHAVAGADEDAEHGEDEPDTETRPSLLGRIFGGIRGVRG